jgi:hypothetical protein
MDIYTSVGFATAESCIGHDVHAPPAVAIFCPLEGVSLGAPAMIPVQGWDDDGLPGKVNIQKTMENHHFS